MELIKPTATGGAFLIIGAMNRRTATEISVFETHGLQQLNINNLRTANAGVGWVRGTKDVWFAPNREGDWISYTERYSDNILASAFRCFGQNSTKNAKTFVTQMLIAKSTQLLRAGRNIIKRKVLLKVITTIVSA